MPPTRPEKSPPPTLFFSLAVKKIKRRQRRKTTLETWIQYFFLFLISIVFERHGSWPLFSCMIINIPQNEHELNASVIKCRCFQVKSSGKVRIFYSHTPILHACHVSDDRSRSMICIIFIIYIFFFFVRPVVHHGLLFCEYLSLTWLNFILSHWDFIAPIIYSNAIFFA